VTKSYDNDLSAALSELKRLITVREDMEAQIARQKRKVAALQELVESDESGTKALKLVDGVTDACRTVLRAAGRPLLPSEVRDGVLKLGLTSQINLLASVYTVLRRLKFSGEVIEGFQAYRNPVGSAVMAYRWAGPMRKLGYPNYTNTQKE